MRTRGFMAALCVIALLAPGAASTRGDEAMEAAANLVVDPHEHDFGEVGSAAVLEQSFALHNRGRSDVRITRLNATAGALGAQLLDAGGKSVLAIDGPQGGCVVHAGETRTLLVTLDARELTGSFRRRVLLHSDDPGHEFLSIVVSAERRGASAAPPPADARAGAEVARPTDLDAPVLELDADQVDFGTTMQGEVLKRSLTLRNAGAAPLRITRLASTCGCTVSRIITRDGELRQNEIDAGRALIDPGDQATLEIELNTRTFVGQVRREVRVFSNDPARNPLVIPVTARPEKAYDLSPATLTFGRVVRGHVRTLGARLDCRIADLDIVRIEAPAPYLAATWKRTVPLAADRESPHAVFDIEVSLAASAPLGTVMQPCEIITTSSKLSRILLPVQASVTSEVIFDTHDPSAPDRLDFGMIDPRHEVVREIDIRNENRAIPYRAKGIEVLGRIADHVKPELLTQEDGVAYRLKLTITPGCEGRYFRGIVRLSSEHPDVPTKDIPFQGWLMTRP